MTGPLRAAIIGAGRIASTYDDAVVPQRPSDFFQGERRHPGLYTIHPVNHAEAYKTTNGYELVAVVGRDPERQHAFAERWGVHEYADLETMLAAERPDVVSICTQSADKAEAVIRIAKAGTGVKAIIVEKAMATSVAECDDMIGACADAGILLAVNHPYRFSPMARDVKARVEAGEIGTLGTISGFSAAQAVHVGTHVFDLLRFIGGDIVQIVAMTRPVEQWTDQGATVMVRFASGVLGFVSLERPVVAGFDLRGSTGQITFSTNVGDAWKVTTEPLDPNSPRRYPMVSRVEAIAEAQNECSTTQRLFAEVRASVLDGVPLVSTGEDGRAALEAGIAALISTRDGIPVDLPLSADLRSVSVPNR
jgi:predicted dehydrogenase